jgi:hypothetical protein
MLREFQKLCTCRPFLASSIIIVYKKEKRLFMSEQKTTETEPDCTCVILNSPVEATTSMWLCAAHGEPDDLSPLPGQGLKYCILISQGDEAAYGSHTLIGPLVTADGIETAKFYARHLDFKIHGVLPLMATADLAQLATAKGAGDGPPPGMSKLPVNLKPQKEHEPGCVFAPEEHPGGCYIKIDIQPPNLSPRYPVIDRPQA